MSEEGEAVQLYVYDLSNGLARQLSPMLLGHMVEAIYHTGVAVGGIEYFFGGGVQRCIAGQTPFGEPMRKVELGVTHIPKDIREELLADLSRRYTADAYNLIDNNCNHFSNAWSELLTGSAIPEQYYNQAQSLLQSPLGQMVLPMMAQMEQRYGNVTAEGFQNPSRPT
ncbi:Desumoylating isopeptidase 1 [Tetrabaena socialis]|uniref:Desumoylating isopeptidase 1 n=1 Tax=Tetrabaena socialis TaxID=47790 RepID=A0A2J7ZXW8_9CHLO|nr:Desumoylating isopeptidase 1 [Tetrabaena socialis]|eukprot:PNH05105.1 Desumoylating isopeptidase 1 [Tetrabaena socialis]